MINLKTKFIAFSVLAFVILVGVYIGIDIFLYTKYLDKFNYYNYLLVLIFVSMVIPMYFIVLACIYEAKKYTPEIRTFKLVSMFIYAGLGVLLFFVVTNFIKFKHYPKFDIWLWLAIPLIILISAVIGIVLEKRTKSDPNGPKIVKRQ